MSMVTLTKKQSRRRQQPALHFERHIGYWLRRVSAHVQGASFHALQKRHVSVAEWDCAVPHPGSAGDYTGRSRGNPDNDTWGCF